MILQEFIQKISERMTEVRGGVRRSRLLVGVALCVVLLAFVGCPDGAPDTAPPVITLDGRTFIVVAIGGTFADPGFGVGDNDFNYSGTVTATITGSDTINTATAGVYTITYTAPADAAGLTPATVTRTVRVGADADADGRLDINFLEDLSAIRNNPDALAARCGADGTAACTDGYDLTRDLDFADGASYASGTVRTTWRPAGDDLDSSFNPGWVPIGTEASPFSGSFSGDGFVIANLYVRRNGHTGLFGSTSSTSTIERIGVVDVSVYGVDGNDNAIGGLVGQNTGGTITASYATGSVNGGVGGDSIGGLVGRNGNAGTIMGSYTTASVDGGAGADFVGGLTGFNTFGATITASYATGEINGGAGSDSDGDDDTIGGLTSQNRNSTITASYATGEINGEGGGDDIGGLVFSNLGSVNTASYGFGTLTNRVTTPVTPAPRSTDASPPGTVANACALTQANSSTTDTNWDATQWDFGTATQRPVVLHNGEIVRGQTDRDC